MDTSTDTTQTQTIPGTDNPQAVSTPLGASVSRDFQQAAGLESLQQNKTLQVLNEGTPIQGGTTVARPVSAYVPLVLVLLALGLLSARLFRWVKAAPVVISEPVKEPVKAVKLAPKPTSAKKSKKKTRSKRRK